MSFRRGDAGGIPLGNSRTIYKCTARWPRRAFWLVFNWLVPNFFTGWYSTYSILHPETIKLANVTSSCIYITPPATAIDQVEVGGSYFSG